MEINGETKKTVNAEKTGPDLSGDDTENIYENREGCQERKYQKKL